MKIVTPAPGALVLIACLGLATATGAHAQPKPQPQPATPPPAADPSRTEQFQKGASQMAVSPLRDMNIWRDKIPPVLIEASERPYELPRKATCRALAAEVLGLDEALGPDVDMPSAPGADGMSFGSVAQTLAQGLIPMRTWIRKLSGAEKNDAAVRQAIASGQIRRGFLKGVGLQKGCKSPAAPAKSAQAKPGPKAPAAAKAAKPAR
ncbi:MAG: hypothetical protein JWP92_3253 [Caulobacter sp.]|nr:hypothetical protein [Caulobacter sp.]